MKMWVSNVSGWFNTDGAAVAMDVAEALYKLGASVYMLVDKGDDETLAKQVSLREAAKWIVRNDLMGGPMPADLADAVQEVPWPEHLRIR